MERVYYVRYFVTLRSSVIIALLHAEDSGVEM